LWSLAVLSFLVWAHIAWDYFHGGIPSQYLLQSGDLPGIPNWWGAIVLPFFTWFLLWRISKRINGTEPTIAEESLQVVIKRFTAAMLIAVIITVLFTMEIAVIEYIVLGIFVMVFFSHFTNQNTSWGGW